MTTDQHDETVERAERRAHFLAGLEWHAGTFVILNMLFWLMDIGLGQGGVQWAYWIAIPWGFALAFHALAYMIDGRQVEEHKTREFIRQEEHETSGRS
jgi:hypothetical protein